MAVTIKEIARAAGVSYATVSRALNAAPGVGEATRERVLALADRLGYVPDPHARALVTGRVPFLGLVVPDITNPFFPALARGAEEEAARHGYSLLLLDTDWAASRLRDAVDLLVSRRVAGLLVAAPLDALVAEGGRGARKLRGRAVMAGVEPPPGAGLSAVEVNDLSGGAAVAAHLLERGYRRVAFVGGAPDDRATRQRLEGLRRGLASAGLAEALSATSFGRWSVESGHEQAAALLRAPAPPDAIFAANDLLALGAWQAAREADRRLGAGLGLVGYDDIDAVRLLDVPVTSVAQPKREVGRHATEILLKTLEGGVEAHTRRLEPTLVVRASTAGPRR